MIKIDRRFKNENSTIYNPSPGRVVSSDLSLKQGAFSQEVQAQISSRVQSEISDLIAELDKSGKRFGDNPNAENLHLYKRNVQSFLHFVNKQSFHVKEIYGRRIDYKIVGSINKKLEDLSNDIIKRESGRLDLMAKIDEIRGMIIDLLL